MSPFVRKVPTASGATAVQIVDKTGGKYRILEHLGSAHTPEDLATLVEAGKMKLADPGQATIDFDAESKPRVASAVVKSSRSEILIDTIRAAYNRLGFDIIDDEAFFQLVTARLVEPTSKSDSVRVLDELGIDVVHRNTFLTCLKRAQDRNYRAQIAAKCFDHSVSTSGINLLLYDVTTLYFEAEKEDDLRKSGTRKNGVLTHKSLSVCSLTGPGSHSKSVASRDRRPKLRPSSLWSKRSKTDTRSPTWSSLLMRECFQPRT